MVGERVRVARLDSLLPPGVPIHVIKADIEGGETLALAGASGLLDAHRPCAIIFELNESVTTFTGVDGNALVRAMVKRGYRLYEPGGSVDKTPGALGPSDKFVGFGDWELRLMTGEARCAGAQVAA